MKRSLLSRLASVSVLAGALALVACSSGGAASGAPATAESAVTKAPVAPNAAGPLKLVSRALSEVPLRADQRTEIEKLVADAGARHTANRQARVDVMNAVAAQVEAGAIDRAALQPKIDAAVAAWQASSPADRAAIERLHAILDASQRAQLVDAFHGAAHGRDGHDGQAGPGHHGRGDLAKLVTDLKLTDDQQDRIKTIVRDQMVAHHGERKEGHAKGKAMLEAFKSDHFVIDEVAPPPDARAKAAEMTGRMLNVVEQILPILTPEQRTLAAAKIRERAEGLAEMPAPILE